MMGANNNYDNKAKNGAKKITPKMIAAIVAAVAILAAGAVVFGQTVIKMISPETYLLTVIENTTKNMRTNSLGLPDFSVYADTPIELDFAAGIGMIDEETFGYEASAAAAGSSFDARLKIDAAAEKLLADLSFNVGGLQLDNNQLYLSKELAALSVPLAYSEYRYITVNPATFTADWNASEFGGYAQVPVDFDLQTTIDALFDDTESVDLQSLRETLLTDMTIRNEGGQETTFGADDAPVRLERFNCLIAADSINRFYDQLAAFYESQFSRYAAFSGANADGALPEGSAALVEAIRSIHIENDLPVYLYVGDQLIKKVEMPSLEYTVPDASAGGAISQKTTVIAEFYGEKNLLDAMDATIVTETDGEKAAITFTRLAASENDTVTDDMTAVLDVANAQVLALNWRFRWDQRPETAENMTLTVDADIAGAAAPASLNIVGYLMGHEGETSLRDAVYSVRSGEKETITGTLNCGIRHVEATDIAIDEADSISFFELSIMDLLGFLSLMQ